MFDNEWQAQTSGTEPSVWKDFDSIYRSSVQMNDKQVSKAMDSCLS